MGGVAKPAARAGVQGCHELEVCREGKRAAGARNGDDVFFQRLAHHLQRSAVEFRQLIQEQHAVVRQADLARARIAAAADQPGVADGVMRAAERGQPLLENIVGRNAYTWEGGQADPVTATICLLEAVSGCRRSEIDLNDIVHKVN